MFLRNLFAIKNIMKQLEMWIDSNFIDGENVIQLDFHMLHICIDGIPRSFAAKKKK